MKFDEMADLCVLLVDDDGDILKTTTDILGLSGVRAVTATSAKEALSLAASESPAVTLVDLVLPDMDGLELAGLLGADPHCSEVIILTGNASVDSAVRALRQQSVDYLIKPVEQDVLLHSVERAASRFFRRRAETLLAESEEQLRRIFATVSDGLIVTDDAGQIVRVNAAAERIMGIEAEDLTDAHLDAVLFPVHGASGPEETEHGEAEVRRPDGSVRRVEVAVATFAPGRSVHTVRDVTAQREIGEQLRQAQKMESIGRLAGGIAHDFNNLLTSINGNCEVALLDFAPDDPARACIEEVRKSGERAANLTRQLLAFSRKQVLQPRVLDLVNVVRGMEGLLGTIIGEQIEQRFIYGPDVGPVLADPTQVEQVVLNLSINARDAMPLGGTLTIETEGVLLEDPLQTGQGAIPPGAYTRISVNDTGDGIPADVQPSVFEPFFTTKPLGEGTGLGLATVYGIVRQSGGELVLESEQGEGTTIRMYLPRVDGEAAGNDVTALLASSEPSQGETILIAEDEDAVRALMVRTLSRLGYRVLTAADGAEALRIFETHKGAVDLVIADVVMPDVSGAELVDRLKSVQPDLPVLFITGYTDDVLVHHQVLAGIALLEKPFSLSVFAEKVHDVLARARREAGAGVRQKERMT